MSPRKKEDFERIQAVSREKILASAFELFANKGYLETSVDKIATKAKVSKGLIYHYFSSKQAILKGIFGVLMQKLSQFVEETKDLPPKAYIDKLVDFSFEFIIHQTKINRLLLSLTVQPSVVAGLKEEMETTKSVWMNKLVNVFQALGYDNPEAEAYLLGAMFDGVGVGFQVFGKQYPIEEIKIIIQQKYNL